MQRVKCVAASLCLALLVPDSVWAQDPSDVGAERLRQDAAEKSVHDYTVSLRGAVWLTWDDGKV